MFYFVHKGSFPSNVTYYLSLFYPGCETFIYHFEVIPGDYAKTYNVIFFATLPLQRFY